jgi:hypothetical protein
MILGRSISRYSTLPIGGPWTDTFAYEDIDGLTP